MDTLTSAGFITITSRLRILTINQGFGPAFFVADPDPGKYLHADADPDPWGLRGVKGKNEII